MYGLNAIYDKLSIEVNDCLVSKEKNQQFIDNVSLSVVDYIKNIDSGTYISTTFKIETNIGILYNRVGDITNKYDCVFADIPTNILSHSTDGIYDYIECSVNEILVDSLTDMSLTIYLRNLLHVSSSFFLMESFRPPKDTLFSGETVTVKVSTKNDRDRQKLNTIVSEILTIVTKQNRRFPIMDNGNKIGIFQLTMLPDIQDVSYDDCNTVIVTFTGYYLVKY